MFDIRYVTHSLLLLEEFSTPHDVLKGPPHGLEVLLNPLKGKMHQIAQGGTLCKLCSHQLNVVVVDDRSM